MITRIRGNKMDRQKFYRLPVDPAKFTEDVELYIKEWTKLVDLACSFFPGYTCAGFNPDIALNRWEKNRFGETIITGRLILDPRTIREMGYK